MDHNFNFSGSTKAGTIGGTLLILFINLDTAEVMKTMLLAATGASVSFTVSLLLKTFIKRIRRK